MRRRDLFSNLGGYSLFVFAGDAVAAQSTPEDMKKEFDRIAPPDSVLFSAATKDGKVEQVMVRCDKTEHLYRIKAKIFCDCTGDSRLALETNAEMRWGREARSEFGESLAPEKEDKETLGSSILFT